MDGVDECQLHTEILGSLMDVFKLNSSHYPAETVGNFDSLVWAERYEEAGDFEMEKIDDISLMVDLPLGTLISHTDTDEVMIVETHEFHRDNDKKLHVKVSGRSLETFAECRTTPGTDDPLTDSESGAAIVEITASTPSCHAAAALLKARLEFGTASADEYIANLLIREDMSVHDTSMEHEIQRGDLYSAVRKLLKISGAGIRTSRPHGAQTTLDFVIHDGADKTDTVVFYSQYEDLEDTQYLTSLQAYRNYAKISTAITSRTYRHRALTTDLTGLNRRVMYVEASELEGAYSPPTNTDVVAGRAQGELDENIMMFLMQAKVSNKAKPRFKIDYDVGDIVAVFGEFSVVQPMRVTEHILTVDKKGMRGFPALKAL